VTRVVRSSVRAFVASCALAACAPLSASAPAPRVVAEPEPLRAPPRVAAAAEIPFVAEAAVSIEEDILRWTNVERIAAGVPALAWSPILARAAREHSEEMVRLRYFAHESPTPTRRTPMMRARLAGLDGPSLAVGENLFRGNWRSDRARRVVRSWMGSPGHRENLLRPEYRYLGVGIAWDRDFLLATQVFSTTP
jgi:uncharacterized protein YkwD